jgi:hypothetical protein
MALYVWPSRPESPHWAVSPPPAAASLRSLRIARRMHDCGDHRAIRKGYVHGRRAGRRVKAGRPAVRTLPPDAARVLCVNRRCEHAHTYIHTYTQTTDHSRTRLNTCALLRHLPQRPASGLAAALAPPHVATRRRSLAALMEPLLAAPALHTASPCSSAVALPASSFAGTFLMHPRPGAARRPPRPTRERPAAGHGPTPPSWLCHRHHVAELQDDALPRRA